jgi:hypothetical protein
MIIIGVDFHPEFQQMACVDTETGEFKERSSIATRRKAFIVSLQVEELWYGWAWKRVVMRAG